MDDEWKDFLLKRAAHLKPFGMHGDAEEKLEEHQESEEENIGVDNADLVKKMI